MRTAKLLAACLPTLVVSAACDSTAPAEPAVPLASITIDEWGGFASVEAGMRVYAGYGTGSAPTVLFLDSLVLAQGDTGSHVVLTRGSPEFGAAEALLTNGVDDQMMVGFATGTTGLGGGIGTISHESVLIQDRIDGSTPPDLQGLFIERITVDVDDVQVFSPGRDPEGDGNWTDYVIRARIVFEGHP